MNKCLKSYIKDKEDLEGIQRSRSHAPDALAIKAVTSKQKNNSQRGQTQSFYCHMVRINARWIQRGRWK